MGKFDFLTEELGLRKAEKQVYAGKLQNYWTVVRIDNINNAKICHLRWSAYRDGDAEVLKEYLDPLTSIRGVKVKVNGAVVEAEFPVALTEKGFREKFDEVKNTAFSILDANGYHSGSFFSGADDGTLSLVERGGAYFYLTESEFHQFAQDLEQEQEEEMYRSENIVLGLIGVLGVAILGIIAYVLVGMAGYYVWIVPAALIFGSCAVYAKMAGKLSKKGLVLIFVIMAAAMVAATYLEYTWRLYNHFKKDYLVTFFEVLKETGDIIEETPELKRSIMKDVVINGIALLVATVISYASIYRQGVRFQKLRKVE